MSRRPTLAFAMHEGWHPLPLTESQRAQLEQLCDVVDWTALGSFEDERARSVLARTEILFGHWGCPTLDGAALERAPELRLFVYAAGTLKSVVTPAVFERGIAVTSAAAANAVPVAEFALAAILLANKNAFVLRELQRTGGTTPRIALATPGNFAKTVGLVGASHVGRLLIELLRPFALEVLVADPFLRSEDGHELGVEKVGLDDLLARADIVSLHAPALPETVAMIGAAELALMQDGAVLVNTARGVLVDSAALEAELASGRLSAVLDVTDPDEPLPPNSPLLQLPNVFVTPHIAGSNGTELERLADFAVEEVRRYVADEPFAYPVRAEDLGRIA